MNFDEFLEEFVRNICNSVGIPKEFLLAPIPYPAIERKRKVYIQPKLDVKNGCVFYRGQILNVGHIEPPAESFRVVHINGAKCDFIPCINDKLHYDFKNSVAAVVDQKIMLAQHHNSKAAVTFLGRAGIEWKKG